jgi:hypothetical protein
MNGSGARLKAFVFADRILSPVCRTTLEDVVEDVLGGLVRYEAVIYAYANPPANHYSI